MSDSGMSRFGWWNGAFSIICRRAYVICSAPSSGDCPSIGPNVSALAQKFVDAGHNLLGRASVLLNHRLSGLSHTFPERIIAQKLDKL